MFLNILVCENHDNLLYFDSLAENTNKKFIFFGSYCQNIKGLLKNSGNFGQNSPRHFVGMWDSKYRFVILSHRESFYTCAGCLLGAVV
jgi:hypothetical protein